jgi:hypothetical protein
MSSEHPEQQPQKYIAAKYRKDLSDAERDALAAKRYPYLSVAGLFSSFFSILATGPHEKVKLNNILAPVYRDYGYFQLFKSFTRRTSSRTD